MDDKELIKTVYNDTVQYWLATIEENSFSIRDLISSESFNTYPIIKYVDNLKSPWNYKVVTFTPITENTLDAYYSRAFHRGYETDTAPFMLRNKKLPELVGKIYNENYRDNVSFESIYRSSNQLTPGQMKWLKEMFGNQLSAAYTKELVDHLVNRAIKRMQHDVSSKLTVLKTNANKFEDFVFSR